MRESISKKSASEVDNFAAKLRMKVSLVQSRRHSSADAVNGADGDWLDVGEEVSGSSHTCQSTAVEGIGAAGKEGKLNVGYLGRASQDGVGHLGSKVRQVLLSKM